MPGKSRRAVRLSRVDAERLARGEFTEPEEAVHNTDPPATKTVGADRTDTGRDAEILRELPPHFGRF